MTSAPAILQADEPALPVELPHAPRRGVTPADLAAWGIITLLWLLPAAFLGHHGGFPLNDDWAYTYSVKHFLEHGELWRTEWTYIPLITHTLIGAAFSKLFGFSFETLRLSGLFMGWVGLIGVHTLCRAAGTSAVVAAFAALLVAFNPLYLNLSYTFMTDVPFAAMAVWSIALLLIGMRRWSYALMALGVLLGIAATLSRQFGLAVAGSFALTLVATAPRNPRRWIAAAAVVAINVAIYLGLPFLLYGYLHTIRSDSWVTTTAVAKGTASSAFLKNGVFAVVYLGLFLSPMSLVLALQHFSARRRTLLIVAAATAAVFLLALLALRWRLPRYNMIYDLGVGPMVIGLKTVLIGSRPLLWWPITAVGAASACLLLVTTANHLLSNYRNLFAPRFLLPAAAAAAYAPVVLVFGMDRYLLPVIPLLAAATAIHLSSDGVRSRRLIVAGSIAILVIGAFSVCGTRDYLTRHRTNWALLSELTTRGVTTDQINGGFEFSCWNNHGVDASRIAWETKGAWVIDDTYVISYDLQLAGYTPIQKRSYQRLLPPGTETVTLYEREPSK